MDRASILTSLIEFSRPLPELRAAVRTLSWDWPGDPLVVLKREHVVAVLRRYQRGEIEASDVEAWADLVEMREDIEYDPRCEDDIADARFYLSTPEINGPLEVIAPKVLERLER